MDDNSIMPYGKHNGKKMSEVPRGWFIYHYDRNQLKGDVKAYAEEIVPVLRIQRDQIARAAQSKEIKE